MTQILVITHGGLAREMLNIVESILGKPVKAVPVCLELHHDQMEYSDTVTQAINSFAPEDSIIILTDLFGGTPSNLAIPFVHKDKIEVITGLNLSMLLYLLTQPEDKNFQDLCRGIKQAGKDAIIIAGEFLS